MTRYFFILALISTIGLNTGCSQPSDKKGEMLLIREDVVKPSMAEKYELSLLDLNNFLVENKVSDVNYLTHIQDDFHYLFISDLNDLDDLDGGIHAYTNGEKSSDEYTLIWDMINESRESYRFYIVKYDKENSYVPDGNAWLEESHYRKWNYYYFDPGTEKEVDEILAAWNYLYKQNNIKSGYRVYRGVLGIDQLVVIFISWAKDGLEHHQNLNANIEILGEEGSALLLGMLNLSYKAEAIEGYFLPQYSYDPE
jgi:hypothetical protein